VGVLDLRSDRRGPEEKLKMPTILCGSNLCKEDQSVGAISYDGYYRTTWEQQLTHIVIVDAHVTGNPYWEAIPSKPVADVLYTAPPENPPTTWPTPVPPDTGSADRNDPGNDHHRHSRHSDYLASSRAINGHDADDCVRIMRARDEVPEGALMADEFEVADAVREKVALLIALYGPTGSGKTYSGLLMAGGLAGPNGLVGMVDAENKRGSLYADDPKIRAAMPGGKTYKRVSLTAPYTPARYIQALKSLEKSGCTVAVIDSTTHEWSGEGGCVDIAEENKLGGNPNWAKAKREHKKFMAYCMSSKMHIVFCLRAHEASKPVKSGDIKNPETGERYQKSEWIPMGMVPDTEKNLIFEMLLSFRVEDKTHKATAVKVPGMLAHLFPEPRLLTAADGAAIREWNESGQEGDGYEKLAERARLAAEEGMLAYQDFFNSIQPVDRAALKSRGDHDKYKAIAGNVEAERKARQEEESANVA
jgi:hypothetical protein